MEKNNNIGNECLQPIIRYLLVGGLLPYADNNKSGTSVS